MNRKTLLHVLDRRNWRPDNADLEVCTPGLYMLLDDEDTPVYIGHSGNLPCRLAQHAKEGTKIFAHTAVYHGQPGLSSESGRLQLETILIMFHKPKYNKGLNLGLSNGKIWEIKWKKGRTNAR